MNASTATSPTIPVLDPENIAITEFAEIRITAEARAIMAEESAAYEQEYAQAVIDLHREQHQSLGLLDTVKTMFMWMDSPDERVSKNRSQHIDLT